MSSENKKRKAKNSYLHNGAEKSPNDKLKRIRYYTNTKRYSLKRDLRKEITNEINT